MTEIRLTINIKPDPEHPTSWVATCLELGVVSASLTPQLALTALANAVRLVVNSVMDQRRMLNAADGIEVMREIAAGYASQCESEQPRSNRCSCDPSIANPACWP